MGNGLAVTQNGCYSPSPHACLTLVVRACLRGAPHSSGMEELMHGNRLGFGCARATVGMGGDVGACTGVHMANLGRCTSSSRHEATLCTSVVFTVAPSTVRRAHASGTWTAFCSGMTDCMQWNDCLHAGVEWVDSHTEPSLRMLVSAAACPFDPRCKRIFALHTAFKCHARAQAREAVGIWM